MKKIIIGMVMVVVILLFCSLAFGAAQQQGETDCSDGIDNDWDGDFDCDDSDCSGEMACLFQPAPQPQGDDDDDEMAYYGYEPPEYTGDPLHSAAEIEGGDFPDEEEFTFNGKIYVSTPTGYTISTNNALLKSFIDQSGVYAIKAYNGDVAGSSGHAVYGYASGDNSEGVYGYSSLGHGIYGRTEAWGSCGVYGVRSSHEAGLACDYYGLETDGDIQVGGDIFINDGVIFADSNYLDFNGEVDFHEELQIQGKLDSVSATCCDGSGCGNCDITDQDDVAETFYTKEEPGTVVSLVEDGKFKEVSISVKAYDTKVIGIISADPTITMGEENENMKPVALTGVVTVKASAENGAIKVGDLLTTANTKGHVMKCSDEIKCIGAIIGKAMEPLGGGTGEISVLVLHG